jgi:hypothetical protein
MGPESRSVFGPEGGAWLNSRGGFFRSSSRGAREILDENRD